MLNCAKVSTAMHGLMPPPYGMETPCGTDGTVQEDTAFFAAIEAEQYRQQYWQHSFFDFDQKNKKVLRSALG